MLITRRGLVTGLSLATLSGSSLAAYAAGIEPLGLRTTHYRLTPPGWPASRNLSIAVIADLHAGGPNMGVGQIRNVVDAAQAERADLIVLLGDFFATHRFVTERVPHPVWAAELGRLSAPLGVYAILGNHDWWFDIEGTRRALGTVNIPILQNDALLLGEPGRRFWLAGLGDTIAYRLGRGRFAGVDDLPGTLARVTTDDPVILLVHEPDIFTRVPERVSLTLAGHTHGGQIRVPFVWPRFVPSRYGARFAYGHIVETDRHMIVSGGLGTSAVPMRLGVPPEILRIELGA
jgi:predicted MPP superfamily phosphohydrolase